MRHKTHQFIGQYEFVRKGDPPVVGITKLGNGVTIEQLKRPRREVPLGSMDKDTNVLAGTPPSESVSTSTSPEA